MKPMTIDDIHESLLGIAKEMHRICVKYNIPYYMLGGTMLGAIRHKGFIPWDDDMDLGVPREYYEQLRSILGKEMNNRYRIISEEWISPITYYKIEDMKTITYRRSRYDKNVTVGLNIDVFPLDHCTLDYNILTPIFKRQRWLNVVHIAHFADLASFSLTKQIVLKAIRLIIPFTNNKWLRDFKLLEDRLRATGEGGLVNFSGIYNIKEVLEKSIFGTPQLYSFEDTELYGPENADGFLKHMYGDYMKLPPENSRRIHSLETFMKN